MKPQSLLLRSFPPLLLGLAIALPLAGLPLHAQTATPPPRPELPTAQGVHVPKPGEAIIPRAQFQGSNLGEVIDYLAEQTNVNLMVSPEVKALPVPDMNLRNVTGIGLLRAIADMGVPFQVTETPPEVAGENPVWVIVPLMTIPEVQTNVTRIYNLSGLQAPLTDATQGQGAFGPDGNLTPEAFGKMMKDISDAINTALTAREEATKGKVHYPVLKIHEATRLMVVSGNQQEVEIAQQVICALGGRPVN